MYYSRTLKRVFVAILPAKLLLFFDICKSRGFFVAFLRHFSIYSACIWRVFSSHSRSHVVRITLPLRTCTYGFWRVGEAFESVFASVPPFEAQNPLSPTTNLYYLRHACTLYLIASPVRGQKAQRFKPLRLIGILNSVKCVYLPDLSASMRARS